MNIVFLSNYFNHHQRPLSEELAKRSEYTFVTTEPMPAERIALGWGEEDYPAYVCDMYSQPHRAKRALEAADAVIVGTAPETIVRKCIAHGHIVLRYSERPLKNGGEWYKYLPRLLKWHLQNPMSKTVYLLCASAYTAGDYARFGLFKGRAFRWGYFPETKHYNLENLMTGKKTASILWCGRYLDWKHPDDAIFVATMLKKRGYSFSMNLIGRGEMEEELQKRIETEGLQEYVHMLGSMSPEKVRRQMEEASIFLFTSDCREGWGAVLNEAMNSGCAVVASNAPGATEYLVRSGENGLVYKTGDKMDLFRCTESLLNDETLARRIGLSAYETIVESWNAEIAAERLVELLYSLRTRNKRTADNLYDDGICSPAPIIRGV